MKDRLIKKVLAGVGIMAALVALYAISPISHPPVHAENGRIVTIYHDGQQQVIATDAETVGDALSRAGISLDEHDAVEPTPNTKLIAQTYDVNVYRARPVTVVDGAQRSRIMSPHTSAKKIAEAAGLQVYDEDKLMMTRINDFVGEGGAGLMLTIDRSVPVHMTLYGKLVEVRTQATTVGELLKEKGVKLASQDGVSPAPETAISNNIAVDVYRNGEQTVSEEKEVDFKIKQIQDADQPVGYKKVETPGVKGKKVVTYQIELKNGKEVSRKEIQSVTVSEPKEQVEIVGAKRTNPDPAANRILGKQMMLAAGFPESEWSCLDNLWTRESGWVETKANRGGSGAYGIPQALPGSKMGPGWEDDPVVQIRWGLGYIKGRYSTPCGAWSAFQQKGWY